MDGKLLLQGDPSRWYVHVSDVSSSLLQFIHYSISLSIDVFLIYALYASTAAPSHSSVVHAFHLFILHALHLLTTYESYLSIIHVLHSYVALTHPCIVLSYYPCITLILHSRAAFIIIQAFHSLTLHMLHHTLFMRRTTHCSYVAPLIVYATRHCSCFTFISDSCISFVHYSCAAFMYRSCVELICCSCVTLISPFMYQSCSLETPWSFLLLDMYQVPDLLARVLRYSQMYI